MLETIGVGSPLQVIGLLGVALFIGAYMALQGGYVRGASYAYAGMNAAAASLVLISLIEDFNLSSVITNGFWVAISLFGATRLYFRSRSLTFTEDELQLIQSKLPGLDRSSARLWLDCGRWRDASPGETLTTEGLVNAELIYLADGAATAAKGGRTVGAIAAGAFIGEATALDGAPATATVTVDAPSRLFAIRAATLRSLARSNGDIAHAMAASFLGDAQRKLSASNAR